MQYSSDQFGKWLIFAGLALAALGVLLMLARPLRLGSLPGDMSFGGRGWHLWIPLGSSLLISVILTLLLNIFLRRR